MIKRFFLLLLCLIMLTSVGGVYATWLYATDGIESQTTSLPISLTDYYHSKIVYITNVEYRSGNGSYSNIHFYNSVLQSTVNIPKTNNLTFRITVYNNTDVEQGFDAVVSSLGASGYDNENIIYTLTNLKRPYTVDGVLASDVTRIPAGQSHTFEITFKYADGVTDFSNTTLNSILNFVFKPFDSIVQDHFTSPVDGALEAFKKILNTPADYNTLDDIMDQSGFTGAYVGNVVGSSDNDTKVLASLFDGNLNLMLTDPETGELVKTNLTCMIKREDLDGDGKAEMTIYMTPDDMTDMGIYSKIDNVYAGVFTQVTDSNGNTKWEQLGDLYHGSSRCNDYDSNIFNGFDPSINTDNWRSSEIYHGVNTNSTIKNVIKGYKNQQN